MNDRNGHDDRTGVGMRENHSFVTIIRLGHGQLVLDGE